MPDASVGWARQRMSARAERLRVAVRDPVMILLATILVVGAVLRILISIAWNPGLLGFTDSAVYIQEARLGVFTNPLRVDGYGIFLQFVHWLHPTLSFVVHLQHLLGLGSALLLFGAVRRAGLPRALGLLPAAMIALQGSEIFTEHAPLTEALFIFLMDLGVYGIIRTWQGRRGWAWALLAGLALGYGTDVRTVGLIVAPILIIVGQLLASQAWRQRVLHGAVMLVAAAAPVSAYLIGHQDALGYGGFVGASYFDLYARVAPFADCAKFKPPAGTADLCIHVPPSRRSGHDYWEFTAGSPAVKAYGEPDRTPAKPGENAHLKAFAEATIEHQPGDYLKYVARDLVRIVDPSFSSSPYGNQAPTGLDYGMTPAALVSQYLNSAETANASAQMATGYYTDGIDDHPSSALLTYERDTRIEGPLMAILLILALLAPILARGYRRAAGFLLLTTALLLLVPIFTSEYDYRFTIPAFGPLAATAGIGAWQVWLRSQGLWRRWRQSPA